MEGIALLQTPAPAQLAGLGNSVKEVHILLGSDINPNIYTVKV